MLRRQRSQRITLALVIFLFALSLCYGLHHERELGRLLEREAALERQVHAVRHDLRLLLVYITTTREALAARGWEPPPIDRAALRSLPESEEP